MADIWTKKKNDKKCIVKKIIQKADKQNKKSLIINNINLC